MCFFRFIEDVTDYKSAPSEFGNDYYRSGQTHQGSGGKPLSKKVSTGAPAHLKFGLWGLMIGSGK